MRTLLLLAILFLVWSFGFACGGCLFVILMQH